MSIRIEIAKSYEPKKWKIRIGDLEGNTEHIKIDQAEVIEEIKNAMIREEQDAER